MHQFQLPKWPKVHLWHTFVFILWIFSHDHTTINSTYEVSCFQSLLDLHATASRNNDPHLTKMLEDEFLEEQVESLKKIGDMITRLKRAGTSGLGEYLFDKEEH